MRNDPVQTGITVIMPAFREEASVGATARAATEWLAARGWPHEVIVVDDGSDDGTAAAVEAITKDHPAVRLVKHTTNRGYGAALRTGIAEARHGLVLLTDSDGQCSVAAIDALLPWLESHDVAVGVRASRADSPLRVVTSAAYNTLLRLVFALPNRDTNCPLKLWRREDLQRLPMRSDRFFAPAELLLLASEAGLMVAEQPVEHGPRTGGKSSVSLREIRLMLGEMLRYRRSPARASMRRPDDATFPEWNEGQASKFDHDAYFTSSNTAVRVTGQRRLKATIRALDAKPGDRLLDIGCGDGNLLAALPPCAKTGVDLSHSALLGSRKRLGQGIPLLQMNVEHLEFADGSFDKIACSEVLEHTLHPSRALAEISRVLAPGGTAVVSVPNEGMIKFAKRWSTRLGATSLLSMGKGRSLMPMQNPWHLHDANLSLLKSWLPSTLEVHRVDRVPSALLPLHYVVTLRHPARA
ncbi:MAG TPA: glycosyltransferase [Candidatus Peribacteria bacterium]|nr:glycosyltransferase [Candidatus Peribacteria bacterium]